MKFFSIHRATRSTALVVLLVWLVTLAAGVAKACPLDMSPTHHNDGVTVASTSVVPVWLVVDAQAAADYNDDSDTSKVPFLIASDERSRRGLSCTRLAGFHPLLSQG